MSIPAAPRPAAEAGGDMGVEPDIDPATALSGPALSAVQTLRRIAASLGTPIYFVGGLPRDLVLGRPIGKDLDIVAVGDAVALARTVVAAAGGAVKLHPRFGTATWRVNSVSIDLVTARRERYDQPAALPIVTPGTIEDDLARRDFTVNTLALAIEGEGFGKVIDRHGGLPDLQARVVRALHERSFVDDPTRILRAVRSEVRFGLTMEPATERLARAAVPGLHALSGKRVLSELRLLFALAIPEAALGRLADLGVLNHLGPAPLSAYGARPARPAAEGESAGSLGARSGESAAMLRLLTWLAAGGPAGVACGLRLGLMTAMQRDLATAVALSRDATIVALSRDATIVALSRDATIDAPTTQRAPTSAVNGAIARHRPSRRALDIAAAVAASESTAARLLAYGEAWLDRPAPLDGDDVIALGVAPGPAVGAMLDAVRAAWWDGEVAGSDDAAALVRRRLAAQADPVREGADASGTVL